MKDAGFEPRLVAGVLHCDRPDSRLGPFLGRYLDAAHYWVVVGGEVIDITADQFNYRLEGEGFAAVLIAEEAELTRHIAFSDLDVYAPEEGNWEDAFRRERVNAEAHRQN